MNITHRTLLAGMLSLVFCGPVIAHDSRHADWSGGISIAVAPSGQVVWNGGLTYGPAAVYPARYVAVPAPHRGPVCRHPSHRHHAVHRKGHRHWNGHGKRSRHTHRYH